jgi:hypothetical protein
VRSPRTLFRSDLGPPTTKSRGAARSTDMGQPPIEPLDSIPRADGAMRAIEDTPR